MLAKNVVGTVTVEVYYVVELDMLEATMPEWVGSCDGGCGVGLGWIGRGAAGRGLG